MHASPEGSNGHVEQLLAPVGMAVAPIEFHGFGEEGLEYFTDVAKRSNECAPGPVVFAMDQTLRQLKTARS